MRLFNTRTKQKEIFKPIVPGYVSMYVCGPTVYAKPHLGNARPMIVFDVLYRLLIHTYGIENVKYVRNITDIDDKIINKAKELNCTIFDITLAALKEFQNMQQMLNILKPTNEPKATEYIDRMCMIIKELLQTKHAYINNAGDILFNVESFADYDVFQDSTQTQTGHRFIKTQDKKAHEDFILWKNVTDEDFIKYQFAWETPSYMCLNPLVSSVGRPGWHIECTAMSTALLGDRFDIHGGGADLISPHHQNERAQTCAYTKSDDCANYWMHNGMIQLEHGKMSKSLGNVLYLDEVCAEVHALSVRFYMLQTHYRHPLNWSIDNLKLAHAHYTQMIKNIYITLMKSVVIIDASQEILDALCNDLNTSLSISCIEQHLKQGEYSKALFGLHMLGLLPLSGFDMKITYEVMVHACLKWLQRQDLTPKQEELLQKRAECKKQKDYAQADMIRQQLLFQNIQLDDISAQECLWYVR